MIMMMLFLFRIYKFGATITSWTVKGQELIFTSPKAVMDGSKAIRGGVPICWPSFGPWSEGPQHGFARVSTWSVKTVTNDSVTLTLEADTTPSAWPHKFLLEYTVTLSSDSLDIQLTATNNNTDKEFSFTSALHTYFK